MRCINREGEKKHLDKCKQISQEKTNYEEKEEPEEVKDRNNNGKGVLCGPL